MKLINLELANELLYNEYESIELMAYTKQDKEVDLSEFYELQSIKDLKKVCSIIIKDLPNLNNIDLKITYNDTDFDQLTIYNK